MMIHEREVFKMTITLSDTEQKRIFANNLRDALNRSGKQQIEVARAMGVSQQTFNTWCRGIALPRIGKLEKLANYFGVQKSDLIDRKPITVKSVKGLAIKATPTLKVIKRSPKVYLVSGKGADPMVIGATLKRSTEDKIVAKISKLSPEGKEKALEYIEFLLEKEKK
jgi:transcriptional regulator with XRE-family HTH domain